MSKSIIFLIKSFSDKFYTHLAIFSGHTDIRYIFLAQKMAIIRYNICNKYVKKCPSSIWYWDSNPWPLEHESPPITTSPGLPYCRYIFLYGVIDSVNLFYLNDIFLIKIILENSGVSWRHEAISKVNMRHILLTLGSAR